MLMNSNRSRLSVLDEQGVGRGGDSIDKKKDNQNRDYAIAAIIEREHRLNSAEKHAYGDLLSKDYFTKNDFGSLEDFYDESYEKLSDDGKAELSNRVWGGIRRSEYTFSELPESVREKEAKRLHDLLVSTELSGHSEGGIPDQDRREFIQAYESGDMGRAQAVLGRDSFTQSVSIPSDRITAESVSRADKSEADKGLGHLETGSDESSKSGNLVALDLTGVKLEGIEMGEGEVQKPFVDTPQSQQRTDDGQDLPGR